MYSLTGLQTMAKKIPIDVSTFRILRSEGYIYVDKTKQIYDLITGGRCYLLARPRRFGKSLLVSTLLELFEGNKELFKDLWIDKNTSYQWPVHPVIHLDFSRMSTKSGAGLEKGLCWEMEMVANQHDFSILGAPDLGAKLDVLLSTLSKKNGVVLLIDEYDYPFVNNIETKEIALEIQAVFRSFYSAIKGLAEHIQFVLITGVAKLSMTSLGINNLNDISLDERAASLLGFTHEEIETSFTDTIQNLADKEQLSLDETCLLMKERYAGYRFSEKLVYVYNPLSALYCLHKQEIANYWIETGAPAFLISLLVKHRSIEDCNDVEATSSILGPFEIGEQPFIPILFQAGYLSIANHNRLIKDNQIIDRYTLRYPNLEVAEAFKTYMFAALTRTSYQATDSLVSIFASALKRNDIDAFCSALSTACANIPHQLHIPQEKYYHSLFQQLCTLLKIYAESEVSTDKGRIDMVLQTKTHIFIFELKLNASAEAALLQIEERKYYEKYLLSGKKRVLVGLSIQRSNQHLSLNYLTKDLPN